MEDCTHEFVLRRVKALQNNLVIETISGKPLYFVKPKALATTKTLLVLDTGENAVAKIKQCISLIVPKYRVVIKDDATFSVTRKFSLSHDYLIKGIPWAVNGDFTSFKYRVLDQSEKTVFEINKDLNSWENRYVVKAFNSDCVLYGICIAIAIDAAISAVRSSSN